MEQTRFIAALRHALDGADLAPGTREKTLSDASQFEKWWSGTTGDPLDPDDLRITTVDLQEWRGVLIRSGLTPGTIQRKFASLRAALKLLDPELAVRTRWPKLPQAQVTAPSGFTSNQRNAILRAAERLSPRNEAIVKLLMYTGARASTVAAAKLSKVKINARSGWVEYDVSKNQRTYRVPLCSEARHALSKWLAARPPTPHDFLFCSEGRLPFPPISRAVVWAAWKSLSKHLPRDFPLRGPHAARHDVARRLLSGDEGRTVPTPAADVAALLGHSDPRVCVSIYSRPSPESLQRAVGRLAGDEDE